MGLSECHDTELKLTLRADAEGGGNFIARCPLWEQTVNPDCSSSAPCKRKHKHALRCSASLVHKP